MGTLGLTKQVKILTRFSMFRNSLTTCNETHIAALPLAGRIWAFILATVFRYSW
jgi:hypothetical protein